MLISDFNSSGWLNFEMEKCALTDLTRPWCMKRRNWRRITMWKFQLPIFTASLRFNRIAMSSGLASFKNLGVQTHSACWNLDVNLLHRNSDTEKWWLFNLKHTGLEARLVVHNYARYEVLSPILFIQVPTKIHWKLNDLTMAFRENAIFLFSFSKC